MQEIRLTLDFWVIMGVNMGVPIMIRTDAIQITPEILALVAEIDEFKGAWRASF